MLARLYRQLHYTSAPPSATTTRLTDFINSVQGDLCSVEGLEHLREDVIPVTATANKARTGLPPAVARISKITDRTNNYVLSQVPLAELRLIDPAQANTGNFPQRYAVIGNQAVQQQPAAATGLWVASSAAGDTTQHVFVESIITGGVPNDIISAGTLLTGTARVAIGALTSHIDVTRFYLDAACVGSISLFDAAVAGNELARIPIGQTWSRYLAVEWWPIQTADVTEYADITRKLFDLVKGTDEPLIPPEFHDTLLDGVFAQEYLFMNDARYGVAKARYDTGVKELTAWVMNNPDRVASLRYTPPRWNAFGGNYPNQSPYGDGY